MNKTTSPMNLEDLEVRPSKRCIDTAEEYD